MVLRRLVSADVGVAVDALGDPVPVPADDVVWGAPTTRLGVIATTEGPAELGVWEMTRGACRDVEADETFVVLAGGAVLTVNGGPAREIGPGDLVTLRAGDRTEWVVEDVLRKLYIALADG
jgi:uncharacterized protein